MIKAVLVDLDDTLLQNPAIPFVEAYIRHLTNYLLQRNSGLDMTRLREALALAVRQTVMNRDPLCTNQAIFYAQFTMLMEIESEVASATLADFYRDVYPQLRSLTQPVVAAPALIRWLFDHQYVVAVATNPLFERTAIEQRLEWAGLSIAEWPFQFVTAMENTHFTKPHPHYYEEILTRLGFETDEALMIGDDWANDIAPAQQAGLSTYWVHPPEKINLSGNVGFVPDGHGTLANLLDLIATQGWLETLQPRPVTPEQIIPRMVGNVAALMGMVMETPPHAWNQRPDPDEWSPLEIIVHLRDSERNVQRPRLESILQQDNPFLVAPQAPPAPGVQDLTYESGIQVAREYATARAQTLALLENLPIESWARPARHSVFGPTNLLEMAAFTARHDRLHINQFYQTVGKCE